ncbi:MAG: hypothetical protein ACRC78_12095 [Planktothrix sp.]
MGIFGSSNPKQPKTPAECWVRFWEIRAQIDELEAEEDELKHQLTEAADAGGLWDGKTAIFAGGNKIRRSELVKIDPPKNFSKQLFFNDYPELVKVAASLDKQKLADKLKADAEFAEEYPFEVEVDMSYKFERS